ncbi:myosin heavy chain, clone 203-like isoform X2 [Pocillopora verrucosa]|uniref:myosin heavy chain, clone 203-like isoform X2 n=1 Tax=Pocillopora verrucosa TaxID=203993 RepID=UPI0033407F2D
MGCSSNKCSWKLRMTEEIMNEHFLHEQIGNKWRDLARQLKFPEAVIGTIESDKGASTNECCIAVIVKWIKQEGEDATVEKFAGVLITIGLRNVAEKLPGLLSSEENDEMESKIDEIEKNCKQLRKEHHQLQVRKQELEKEKQSMTKQLQDSLEESQKLRTRIQELEEELSRVKQQLHETSQESQEWKTRTLKLEKELAEIREDKSELDLAENFDNSAREDDFDDTRNSLAPGRGDTEGEFDAKLKDLDELLRKNVTSLLEVPEIKEDKLKVSVTLDLLLRLSVSLQELYTSVHSMVPECCKCSEEVKREFYDFAYHGLRAEHNDVVHRVEDLATTQEKMTDEDKKNFGKLQQLQTNRQRQVDRLENLWKGLFSPPKSRPECTLSDPCGATGKTYHSKKDLRRQGTDPGAKPKQIRPGEQKTSPEITTTTSKDEKYEVCFRKSMKSTITTLFKKREIEEKTCHLMSFSARKHR